MAERVKTDLPLEMVHDACGRGVSWTPDGDGVVLALLDGASVRVGGGPRVTLRGESVDKSCREDFSSSWGFITCGWCLKTSLSSLH